jgi:hypothetical protein
MANSSSEKKVEVAQNASSASSILDGPVPRYGSHDPHVFSNPTNAQHWREVYERAEYEGRHRYDPEYKWTAEEEQRLVRKVSAQFTAL